MFCSPFVSISCNWLQLGRYLALFTIRRKNERKPETTGLVRLVSNFENGITGYDELLSSMYKTGSMLSPIPPVNDAPSPTFKT